MADMAAGHVRPALFGLGTRKPERSRDVACDRGERGGVAEILRSKIIRDRVPDPQPN